jgi:hypothetical protein
MKSEVNMPQTEKGDWDVESLIKLLYLISDALHICEEGSVGGLESTLRLCEMLSSVQYEVTTLLARASGRQSHFLSGSIVDGSEQGKKLVYVCN